MRKTLPHRVERRFDQVVAGGRRGECKHEGRRKARGQRNGQLLPEVKTIRKHTEPDDPSMIQNRHRMFDHVVDDESNCQIGNARAESTDAFQVAEAAEHQRDYSHTQYRNVSRLKEAQSVEAEQRKSTANQQRIVVKVKPQNIHMHRAASDHIVEVSPEGGGDNEHRDQYQALSIRPDEKQRERPEQLELFLDSQRPEVACNRRA